MPLGDEDLMVLRDARRASRVAVRRSFGSETTESELCDFTEEPEDFRDFFMGVWGDKEGYYKYAVISRMSKRRDKIENLIS